MYLQYAIARALEDGRWHGRTARLASTVWAGVAAHSLARRLPLPAGARVVAVGGATLGGSGKTPLAVACARALASMGARVALVGHAYRGHPGEPRQVRPTDPLAQVGDEALVAARALWPRVPVVVAPSRALAIAEAGRLADVLVIDGVLQSAPERVALALLAVDRDEPWGHAQAVPPQGDLRAPVAALRAAADAVIPIGPADHPDRPALRHGSGEAGLHAFTWSRGAWLEDRLVPWDALRGQRVGFACALGRPDRVLRSLARRGIVPAAIARGRDHGPIPASEFATSRRDIDLWLATAKCALHLPLEHPPVATLEYDLLLSPCLRRTLALTARLDPAHVQQ